MAREMMRRSTLVRFRTIECNRRGKKEAARKLKRVGKFGRIFSGGVARPTRDVRNPETARSHHLQSALSDCVT